MSLESLLNVHIPAGKGNNIQHIKKVQPGGRLAADAVPPELFDVDGYDTLQSYVFNTFQCELVLTRQCCFHTSSSSVSAAVSARTSMNRRTMRGNQTPDYFHPLTSGCQSSQLTGIRGSHVVDMVVTVTRVVMSSSGGEAASTSMLG